MAADIFNDYHSALTEANKGTTFTCKRYGHYCNLVYQTIQQKCTVVLPSLQGSTFDLRPLIGMNMKDANQWSEQHQVLSPFNGEPHALFCVISWFDGEPCMMTRDINPYRIRVSVEHDCVVDARIG